MSKFGNRLGWLHFYRDRGSAYVDGFRTSLQVGFIGAGVARGAGFTDTYYAIVLGAAVILLLEGGKIVGGYIDHKVGAIEAHQQAYGDTNPYATKPLEYQAQTVERLDKVIQLLGGNEVTWHGADY